MLVEPGALLIFSLLFLQHAWAAVVNRTIDDSAGDSETLMRPIFLPASGVWDDQTCTHCSITPDVRQAFKGTYTAATYNPGLKQISISLSFEGNAIYVFFILANDAGETITSLTDCDFILDNWSPVNFRHVPDLTTTDILYNQLVFSRTGLPNALHKLEIVTAGRDYNVFVNFDYAIYSHDDNPVVSPSISSSPSSTTSGATPAATSGTSSGITSDATSGSSATTSGTTSVASSGKIITAVHRSSSSSGQSSSAAPTSTKQDLGGSSSSKPPVGGIVGGVIGGLVVLALILFLLICLRRRRKHGEPTSEDREGSHATLMAELETPMQVPPGAAQYQPLSPNRPNGRLYRESLSTQHIITPFSVLPSNGAADNAQSETSSTSAYGIADGGIAGGNDEHQRPGSATSPDSSGFAPLLGTGHPALFVSNGLASPINSPVAATGVPAISEKEQLRRARQQEIDERLRTVQQEMNDLSNDLRGGRMRSVRRTRVVDAGQGEIESEMTFAEMREQMRQMQEEIVFLRDNQRSEWAWGLTDDPPPGYTPAFGSSTNRSSQPVQ